METDQLIYKLITVFPISILSRRNLSKRRTKTCLIFIREFIPFIHFTGCIIKKKNEGDYQRRDKRVQKLFRAFLSSH